MFTTSSDWLPIPILGANNLQLEIVVTLKNWHFLCVTVATDELTHPATIIHNTLLLHFSVKLNLFMNRDFNLCRVQISSFLQTNLILGYSSTEGPSLCVV